MRRLYFLSAVCDALCGGTLWFQFVRNQNPCHGWFTCNGGALDPGMVAALPQSL